MVTREYMARSAVLWFGRRGTEMARAMLRALGDELRASERARRAGTVELALVEEGGVAMTESYFEVPAPAGAAPGALVEVTL